MSRRSCLPMLAASLILAACVPPPARRDDGPSSAALTAPDQDKTGRRKRAPKTAQSGGSDKENAAATDQEVAAFRDYVHAYYDYAIYEQDQARAKARDDDAPRLKELKRAQLTAARVLTRLLGLPDDAPAADLVRRVRRRINRREDIEVLPDIWGAAVASVCVVKLRPGASRKGQVTLFGDERATEVRVFDAVLIEDYLSYRRRKRKQPAAFQGVLVAGPVFYVDGRAVESLAQLGFWNRLEAYRALAKRAKKPAAFAAAEDRQAAALGLVKDVLRWRALSSLVYSYESRPEAVKVARFTEDFIARAELRAAAELRELELFEAAKGRKPKSPEERRALAERAQLSAVIHGEPLGATADIFGLASRALALNQSGRAVEANLRAASTLALEILGVFGSAEKDKPLDGARALFKVSQAEPGDLRAVARAAYEKRSRE